MADISLVDLTMKTAASGAKPRASVGVMSVDLSAVAVPGAAKDPLLLVEYCTTWLPPDLARLPELDLGDGLARPMHCYAHGGFMGAAISMLADPEWESILLDNVAETSGYGVKYKVGDFKFNLVENSEPAPVSPNTSCQWPASHPFMLRLLFVMLSAD